MGVHNVSDSASPPWGSPTPALPIRIGIPINTSSFPVFIFLDHHRLKPGQYRNPPPLPPLTHPHPPIHSLTHPPTHPSTDPPAAPTLSSSRPWSTSGRIEGGAPLLQARFPPRGPLPRLSQPPQAERLPRLLRRRRKARLSRR